MKKFKEYFELFFTFFKLSLFTFGGGYAMLAQIRDLMVEKKKWMSDEEIIQMTAIAESTPGPLAINMATYIGYKKKGFIGSLLATLGVVLPCLIIIYFISLFFMKWMENKYVAYAFIGIKCAVAFLIIKTGISMAIKMEKKFLAISLLTLVIILMAIFEIFSISFSSIYLILFGGLLNVILALIKKKEGDNK